MSSLRNARAVPNKEAPYCSSLYGQSITLQRNTSRPHGPEAAAASAARAFLSRSFLAHYCVITQPRHSVFRPVDCRLPLGWAGVGSNFIESRAWALALDVFCGK